LKEVQGKVLAIVVIVDAKEVQFLDIDYGRWAIEESNIPIHYFSPGLAGSMPCSRPAIFPKNCAI